MVPETVLQCITTLQQAGYPSYLVGGCVRDLLLGKEPQDFDIATAASPETVGRLFRRVVPTGLPFGTVTVLLPDPIEVTTFRYDGRYTDGRHPEQVEFTSDLEADLARRDFTVNAMAWDPVADTLVDPWGGRRDLKQGLIRSVGDPAARFGEDGLRLLRAVRFVSQLEFTIEAETLAALGAGAAGLQRVAKERIGREFAQLVVGEGVFEALWLLVDTGLLEYIVPELLCGQGVKQGRLHREDVLGHNLRTCSLTPPELPVRLAGLLHDVGKAGEFSEGPYGRFFPGHAARSAAAIPPILRRLCYNRQLVNTVTLLVGNHMFFWREPQGLPPVRRLAAQVGWDNFGLLIELIKADRSAIWADPQQAGIGDLEAAYRQVVAERPPLTAAELALSSEELMEELGVEPGPALGALRQQLLEAVWDNPALNARPHLLALARKQLDASRQNSTISDSKK